MVKCTAVMTSTSLPGKYGSPSKAEFAATSKDRLRYYFKSYLTQLVDCQQSSCHSKHYTRYNFASVHGEMHI
jgi:hypothetical protein